MMCKQGIQLLSLIIILVIWPGLASAQIWDNDSGDGLWSTPENWLPDEVPTSNDAAVISLPDVPCVIEDGIAAECLAVTVGSVTTDANCYLEMNGGTLNSQGNILIGVTGGMNGTFTLNEGEVNGGGRLRVGHGSSGGSIGTLIVNGGEMTVYDKIEIGKEVNGNGTVYVYGGTVNFAGQGSTDLEIATRGTGSVYMYGGVVNVEDQIKLTQDDDATGVGRLYLYGGTMNAGNLRDADDVYGDLHIEITEGILVLQEDDTDVVNDYIANGWMTAYDGLGQVDVSYDEAANLTTVTARLSDPELAWNPVPSNFSELQWTDQGPTLSWTSGEYAVSHDVYFGDNAADVNEADTGSALFMGNQTDNSFSPGTLEPGKTYYWRIDEVNDNADAPAGSPWHGTVWQFTVSDYLIVDDFESYGDGVDPGPPPAPGSRVWYTWKDGEGWTNPALVEGNGSGSVTNPPNTETVHGGEQSLELSYENDGDNIFGSEKAFYSEVVADTAHLAIGSDWTKAGVKALSLWFYGDPDNAAGATEQLYIRLNNVRIPYNGPMEDIQEAQWHEWLIDLTGTGVDLGNVTTLAIGLGDQSNTTAGGSGLVYIDDIRLYRPRCLPDIRQPVADLNDDCVVDYDDVMILANDWLMQDSIAVGNDGQLMNFPADDSQWGDGVVRLDGTDDWIDLEDSDFDGFQNRTIALWVRVSEFPEPYPYVFGFANAGDEPYRIYIRTRGTTGVRGRFVEDYFPEFPVTPDSWHHLAFVLRNTNDGLCTGEFYGDGNLVGTLPGRPRHTGGASGVNLGSFNDGSSGFLTGAYDEFRVYDAALSENEIKFLAEVAGGVEPTANLMIHLDFNETTGSTANNVSSHAFARPIISSAELSEDEPQGSRAVNFLDFSVLAENWMQEQLWP